MPNPKPWPEANSDYILQPAIVVLAGTHVRSCPNPFCQWRVRLDVHNAAAQAELALESVAERYYTAAGFRT